ncbi:MAG: peptidase C39 family protein [Candidatus Delongbacteria bacterium]|nr:peptidase C39 family protein [Candidatus Delongbacteria bacterium]
MKTLDLPKLRQTYDYDCGAQALQSILVYYGIELSEDILIKHANTNEEIGTLSKDILTVLKRYNLQYDQRRMSIEDLKNYIHINIPVIILLQAWSKDPVDYKNNYDHGHWVIAIGYDKEKIIFEDPYSFKHTWLKFQELKDRWHAKEDQKILKHYGIAVYGKKAKYESSGIVHMD